MIPETLEEILDRLDAINYSLQDWLRKSPEAEKITEEDKSAIERYQKDLSSTLYDLWTMQGLIAEYID